MDQDSLIYESILDNMSAGVITVRTDGRIDIFNRAAAQLLGVAREDVLGRVFSEVFLAVERLDEFNQGILDAAYDENVGHQRVISINTGDDERLLSLSTSYQRVTLDGETQRLGIIGILSDVTEVRKLREAELRLVESIRAQNAELRDAYLKIEDRNRALATMGRRGRVIAVLIVCLFLGTGLYATNPDYLPSFFGAEQARDTTASPAASQHLLSATAKRKRITSTISLQGHFRPLREVSVASPIRGAVAAIHFRYGERVEQGQLLVELDAAQVERALLEAETAHIKALGRFNELKNWENSAEVARARQSVARAKMTLDDRKNQRDEAAFLLENGLISDSQFEANERQYRDQMLSYEAAKFDLQNVLAKVDDDENRVAQLELLNAEKRLRALEDKLKRKDARAPIAGVILTPQVAPRDMPDAKELEEGRLVTEGEQLLTIGDFENLVISGQVDEVHVPSIHLGQEVRVEGDAFHEFELRGTVIHISAQASRAGRRGAPPTFEIVVAIETPGEALQRRLRPGMSADLEVVVYDKPDALMVPIAAVRVRGDAAWVRVRDKGDGTVRDVRVETGYTTLREVEILRGIETNDQVVFLRYDP